MAKTANIEHLLDEVVTLPSLPSTVANLTELINDPNVTMTDIGKAIAADPSISLKALRLVNSAYYGLREKVSSVEHAVVLLGMKVIKNIVFTASVFEAMDTRDAKLLRHNVACGMAMKFLVEAKLVPDAELEDPDEGFIYGLLHDTGKIIFREYMADEADAVRERCAEGGVTCAQAESEIIGVDHAEIGSRLAAKWKLAEKLIDAIGAHHDLAWCKHAENRPMAALLSIADYVCYEADMPCDAEGTIAIAEEMWAETKLSPEDVAPIVEQLRESTEQIEELMKLSE